MQDIARLLYAKIIVRGSVMNMVKTIKVKNKLIGTGQRIFMTAEIGSAHMGSVEYAKTMIRAAAEADCDGCEIFNYSSGENFYFAHFNANEDTPDSPASGNTLAKMCKIIDELNFSYKEWEELFRYAEQCGIILYLTPLDPLAMRMAGDLGCPMININSDDINNIPLLEEAAKLNIPVTFHDINATFAEVEACIMTLKENGVNDIIALHSTQESGDERTLFGSANLEVINTYKQAFGGLGVLSGCVEHTTSDFLIYAVTALRPALISKHIYLPDISIHDVPCSVNTEHYGEMVRKMRWTDMALGQGNNQLLVSNYNGKVTTSRYNRRKVLVAARAISAGKLIDKDDLIAKRPGHLGGMSPWNARIIVGATARHDIAPDTIISLNHFEQFPAADYKFPELEKVMVKDINATFNA